MPDIIASCPVPVIVKHSISNSIWLGCGFSEIFFCFWHGTTHLHMLYCPFPNAGRVFFFFSFLFRFLFPQRTVSGCFAAYQVLNPSQLTPNSLQPFLKQHFLKYIIIISIASHRAKINPARIGLQQSCFSSENGQFPKTGFKREKPLT